MTSRSNPGSRLGRVAAVENRRRDQAGSNLARARQDLDRQRQRLEHTLTSRSGTGAAEPSTTSAAAMLAGRQATGRMVDRLINDTLAHQQLVVEAEDRFRRADRRAAQMERAVELALERRLLEQRRAEEKEVEDAVIAVSTRRRAAGETGGAR